jgi:hypothetical protein
MLSVTIKSFMLSVTIKSFTLSVTVPYVIGLNDIVLSVVAPYNTTFDTLASSFLT